ncbi:MAG: hypothetical protein AUK47_15835 [Deltaproteobacteria bacterium CG2_30_63_29]|nr:MAG: hypothetical protein AUK47_15835 [Deltaproteobacteria bacterium CG2_30_63_29]PJB37625.1 MAG: hypothetical protein CO108_20725 [Deltaproteobacteria bacterium CG_4_9_14_3_um_filter_63_12]
MSAPPFMPPQMTPPGMGPVPPSKKPVALLALVGLVALCGVAGIVLALMTNDSKPTEESSAEASDQPAKIAAVPVKSSTPSPQEMAFEPLGDDEGVPEITVNIETNPAGAEVFRAGESIGTTPIRKKFPQGDESETWRIFLDGYEIEVVELNLTSDFHSEVVMKEISKSVAKVDTVRPPESGGNSDKRNIGSSDKPKDTTTASKDKGKGKGKGKDKGKGKGQTEHTVITTTTGAAVPD